MPESQELRSWWFKNAEGWRVYADCENDMIYECTLPKFVNRPIKVLADWMRKGGGFSFEEMPTPKRKEEKK